MRQKVEFGEKQIYAICFVKAENPKILIRPIQG